MYIWIWRHLPGPTPVRVLQSLLLFLLVVALLFFVVFPWAEPYLPFDRVTQGAPPAPQESNGECPDWPVCDP
jgi:hypothetical protein